MTSTAAVTIAVAAAATATAIAVGPRIGLLRRRLLSLLGDAVFAGAEAAWVLMSSGPRAAPAWSNHASGGVAPAGHRSLIPIGSTINTQQQSMIGHETPTSTQICGHTTTVSFYQQFIGGPHTFDRLSVFGPPLHPVQSSLLQGATSQSV